ncbi:SDR family NAD(P)-dependent oxidoreductase [Kordia zhangzhouensis]|uniref:SDR family NAD(P)-dependent oxidoreductase n=1 Tax=Kordia zhangzhouensis TaxID=1620405 RepID=UPI00069CAB11|nr:SDR family NAD(P)-dependent oxidoreductase [Kordia zhangzhouensis]
MIDFIEYVVSELKQKRLSKGNALSLIKQFSQHTNKNGTGEAIHPLLHTNTSDFYQQSYRSIFNGTEPFLADHQVKITTDAYKKILPGVAYLEMALAAIKNALPGIEESNVMELQNIVWLQPFFVTEAKELHISLDANSDENIHFEIYSIEGENKDEYNEIIHCEGDIAYSEKAENQSLPVNELITRMQRGQLNAKEIYETYNKLGLKYGASHQTVTTIHQGSNELIAKLEMANTSSASQKAYTLHHGMLDGALQASIGLINQLSDLSGSPMMPFALKNIRVLDACSETMYAWIRYAEGSKAGDSITKLHIDICNTEGIICAQLQGFTSKTFTNTQLKQVTETSVIYAQQTWKESVGESYNVEFEQHAILLCDLTDIHLKDIQQTFANAEVASIALTTDESIAKRYEQLSLHVFEKVQTIIQSKPKGDNLLQIVCANTAENRIFTGIAGLLKTATLENPKLVGQLIFTNPNDSKQLIEQLRSNRTNYTDTVVKHEESTRFVYELEAITAQASEPNISFKENGVYLITGGFGGLGTLFAKEILAQTNNATIILTGRSELTPEKETKFAKLYNNAANVVYRTLNLLDESQVTTFIHEIEKEFQQLTGIIHAAGMTADNYILKKTKEEVKSVLQPKVQGTYHLAKATEYKDIDFIALFSSGVAVLGNPGQADYAAANGFLDQLAHYQNHHQKHTKYISINWPLWKDGGMGLQAEMLEKMQHETGVYPLQTSTGKTAFYQALSLESSSILVIEGERKKLETLLFEKPAIAQVVSVEEKVVEKESLPVATDNLIDKTKAYLRKEFSSVLKISVHKIDTSAALERYGIDSVVAMNLTGKLEKTFGTLSKTLFFEYQTIDDLSEYIAANFQEKLSELFSIEKSAIKDTAKPVAAVTPTPKTELPKKARSDRRTFKRFSGVQRSNSKTAETFINEPIAIVGLSGRYPASVNVEAFWDNLKNGKDCVTEIPAQRWDWRDFYSDDASNPGEHTSKWGGFIEGVDEFDPRFFNISPREASYIDPQERLFLQHAWMAVEDAGYTRQSLQIPTENDQPAQIGVYVGVMYGEYNLSGSLASIANRVSYFLNLHGPSMTLDTMCSSSLTAIHLACQDIKLGRTNMAIAGGVNVSIDSNKYSMLSAGQFISSDGHCQSFGEGGDGYIPGEGVGAVILKRLSDAERDKNHIYGIIKGSALNHGGKTNGYTVPNPNAQAAAISRALRESNTDPKHISYVEAHGTGTKLGDPIEIAALTKAYQISPENSHCLVGSSKSNIGHCESAAGIAGFTKVLLQMKHQQIVPSLHSKRLNPNIDFDKTPFEINQDLVNWNQPVVDGKTIPRLAGLSSFGAGGSNAHIILQEYEPVKQVNYSIDSTEIIVPLSARTINQLTQRALDLLGYLQKNENKVDLIELAYTLQIGREAMDERVGFLVTTVEELMEKLRAFIDGNTEEQDIYRGQVQQNKETISLFNADADFQETIHKWIVQKKYAKIIDLWAKGLNLDWNTFYGSEKIQLISLPTYPFAKETYWNAPELRGKVLPQTQSTAILHPLVHTNTSNLDQVRFSSTFTGKEFFIKDYQLRLNGTGAQKALPALASLEMALAAVQQSNPDTNAYPYVELNKISWGKPFILSTNTQLDIVLLKETTDEVYFEIASQNEQTEVIHAQGYARYKTSQQAIRFEVQKLKEQLQNHTRNAQEIYQAFSIMGLHYGVSNQVIHKVYMSKNALLAEVRLPQSIENSITDFILHPSILDSVVQASICLLTDLKLSENYMFIPVAAATLTSTKAFAEKMYVLVQFAEKKTSSEVYLTADICDENGIVCAQIKGLQLQQIALDRTVKTSKKITIDLEPLVFSESISQKPSDIQLRSLSSQLTIKKEAIAAKPTNISLSNTQQTTTVTHESPTIKKIHLDDINVSARVEKQVAPTIKQIDLATIETVKEEAASITTAPKDVPQEYSKEQLKQMLITTLADALYLEPHEIDAEKSFIDIGLDSIVGVEWIKTINKKLTMELSSTKIYDYATINALSNYIRKELENQQSSVDATS